jgi:rhamnose utilization protein RhaD (predicted bifunctional aldolase and dehydrogenase)/NAD(P)-dependent dehydrogenase (short-subunit alcohol dehydrogenase family)
MKNLYSQADAQAAIAKYGAAGWNEDIALKTYTTRLIGQVPELVLHGGGNSSVKTRLKDTLGEEVDVLCVKGSGWDMGSIEPPGLPAVRLAPLRKLTKLARLTDEDMVNFQRLNLLDSNAPNPSVETLFHAFLPAKFIDHTHANAVLGVSDHANGMDLLREVYGARAPVVDYVMPGFDLAKRAGEVAAAHPKADGLVLHNHGIFAWGATAQESYDRMIELVSLAEAKLAHAGRKVFAASKLPTRLASAAEIAPLIRGVLALPAGEGRFKRFVLDLRASPTVLNFVNGADANRYARAGVITPDHVIRTKGKPMVVAAPAAGALDVFAENLRAARAAYDAEYRAYFETHNARVGGIKKILDTSPRVVLVPGIGAFCAGATAKDAKIAGDLIENAAATIADAEALGPFESVSEADLFDVEYWSLEQAKLGKAAEKRLQRHVALVTGGASGIGLASASAFAAEGCEIVILDRDGASAQAAARKFGGLGLACDVTQPGDVRAAFDAAVVRFGGVDIVVSNAGAAWQGKIGEVDEKTLRDSFELNFFAHQHVAQNAVRVMKAQGTGGTLLFNVSKQAVNPGPDFGPYGLPKASTLFLLRQYAVDYGSVGIRANGINADRVRTGLLTDAMIASRSKARGLSERDYMGGNLLGREVTAEDVAQAFVFLALAEKTTGAILTVDGGNIAAALR